MMWPRQTDTHKLLPLVTKSKKNQTNVCKDKKKTTLNKKRNEEKYDVRENKFLSRTLDWDEGKEWSVNV